MILNNSTTYDSWQKSEYSVHLVIYYNMQVGKYASINGSRQEQLEIIDSGIYVARGFGHYVPQTILKNVEHIRKEVF